MGDGEPEHVRTFFTLRGEVRATLTVEADGSVYVSASEGFRGGSLSPENVQRLREVLEEFDPKRAPVDGQPR